MLLSTSRLAAEAWDARSNGGGVRLMPRLWHQGSYAELERSLHRMRDAGGHERRLWWQLHSRFVWTEERVARVPVRRTQQGPVPLAPRCSEVVVVLELGRREAVVRLRVWDGAVVGALVEEGLHELAGQMFRGDRERVIVPAELLPLVGAA